MKLIDVILFILAYILGGFMTSANVVMDCNTRHEHKIIYGGKIKCEVIEPKAVK